MRRHQSALVLGVDIHLGRSLLLARRRGALVLLARNMHGHATNELLRQNALIPWVMTGGLRHRGFWVKTWCCWRRNALARTLRRARPRMMRAHDVLLACLGRRAGAPRVTLRRLLR